MILTLPFVHLNLRWNPFGEVPREERGSLGVIDDLELRSGEILQFIGEQGHGKSTHLLALAARYPDARYQHIPEGCTTFDEPVTDPFFLDEAQRVKPRRLRDLFARNSTLVIGTHDDLSSLTDRPVRTIRLEHLSNDRLRAITGRRIEWARRGPGPVPTIPDTTIEALISRHGDDVRAIEGTLYDAVQELTEPADVQV